MSKKLQNKIKKVAVAAMAAALKEEAAFLAKRIKQNASRMGLKGTGRLLSSIRHRVKGKGFEVVMEDYGHILDQGYTTKRGTRVKKPFVSGDSALTPAKITKRIEATVQKMIKGKL